MLLPSSPNVRRLLAVGVLGTAAFALVRSAPKLDVPTLFALTMLLALAGAMVFARIVLPWVGDAVGTFFYSSGEKLSTGGNDRIAALLARGDYLGAVREYEKTLAQNPNDLMAVSELAKLRADRLDDAPGALRLLRDALNSASWKDDERAFLRFRIVDILMQMEGGRSEARAELEDIVTAFPNTRFAANARHRLHVSSQTL